MYIYVYIYIYIYIYIYACAYIQVFFLSRIKILIFNQKKHRISINKFVVEFCIYKI